MERNLPSAKLDSDEIAADLGPLKKFGFFKTWDALAGGKVTDFKEVLKMSYNVAHTKILLDYEQDAYRKRLSKIHEAKKPKK